MALPFAHPALSGAVFVILAGSAPSAFAQAFADYEIVSASGPGTQNAACPAGKKAVGGGAAAPGFQFLYETRPETGGNGWRATAQANAFVVAYAVCARVDASHAIATASGSGTQTAACGGTRKVLGGGAFVASFDFLHETRPVADGSGWRATADGNAAVLVYAICADVDATYGIASASGPGTQNPACPAGKQATGGGGVVPSFAYLHEGRPNGAGSAWSVTAAGNAFVQASVVCATPAASIPGEVPLLRVDRISDSTLRLTWDASCAVAAADYGIYAGSIGSWLHTAVDCEDDGSDRTEEVLMPAGDAYYLVVPSIPGQEGSYGRGSSGAERATGTGPCEASQLTTACSP